MPEMIGVDAAAPGMLGDQRMPLSALKEAGVLPAVLEPFISGPRQLLQSAADNNEEEKRKTVNLVRMIDFIS